MKILISQRFRQTTATTNTLCLPLHEMSVFQYDTVTYYILISVTKFNADANKHNRLNMSTLYII